MKNWLRKKLKNFLCEHKRNEWVSDTKTVFETPVKDDPTQEDGAVDTKVLFWKRVIWCKDCEKKITIRFYK
jgi:hypothetical protein